MEGLVFIIAVKFRFNEAHNVFTGNLHTAVKVDCGKDSLERVCQY